MRAEQYFIETWGDSENGKLIKPIFLEHFMTPDNVIQLMQNYAKLKCEEQRRICAENAEMIIEIIGEDEPISISGSHYANADDFIQLDKDSILNSPEPEI